MLKSSILVDKFRLLSSSVSYPFCTLCDYFYYIGLGLSKRGLVLVINKT